MSRDYLLWGDNHRSGSIFGEEDSDILEAVERAKSFKLCLRRIWAVSSSLDGGERNLPSLIPAVDVFSVPSQKRQHHEHEQCTFDFCEHSRVDFTSVEQHHENCEGDKTCNQYRFPLDQLDDRVEKENVTAWKLVSDSPDDTLSLVDSKQPYMAVSHVWADGTGAGTWRPGFVNACLYRFFCKIAREFQCEGCWWDTISIPRTDELRNKALNTMHNNYANARVTLVHDLYLREWEWVDAETACFAIVMSPWYSRGWTALELAKSHKVKILFKSRNDRYVIKDLDVDILAEVSPSSRHFATAKAIRTLRMAKIKTFGDLSSILSPRDTSKPRDIPIISGLLAGVDVSGVLSQQEIYQRILRKLGKVAQGHLFHNSATMAAPGFSWCPTNILDMPRTEIKSDSVWLDLRENGDLEGMWKVYPTDSVKDSDFVWQGMHALTRASLKSALGGWKKHQHLLLTENTPEECTRALLVRPMHWEGQPTDAIYCRFVGPVHFHQALVSRKDISNNQALEGQVLKITITNNDKMQQIDREAWKFVRDMFEEQKTSKEAEATRTDSSKATSAMLDDDDSSWQEMKAVLFLKTDTEVIHEDLFLESSKLQPTSQSTSSDGMVMYCSHEEGNDSPESIKAFFYGHEEFVDKVKGWLVKSRTGTEETIKTEEMMHLSSDKNRKIQVNSSGFSAQDLFLDGRALQLALENGTKSMALPLISLLMENGAPPVSNHKVKTEESQKEIHGGIHLAASQGSVKIAEEIVKYMSKDSLNEEDADGCTALVVAIQKGHPNIVRLLLKAGAATDVCDKKEHTPLHYAALQGDVECVRALLSHAETQCQVEAKSVASDSAGDGEPEGDSEKEPAADAESGGDSGSCETSHKDGTNQMHPEFAEKANLNVLNNQGRTALQLASQKGNSEILELLLRHGACNSMYDSSDQTALALAAEHGSVQAVEILLRDQTDKGHPDKGRTNTYQPVIWKQDELDAALLSAVSKLLNGGDKASLKSVIKNLLKHGARSGPVDASGMAALHLAIKLKDETIAMLLISHMEQDDKTLANKSNKEQQSALVMAVIHGRKRVVKDLLKKGADIKSKDSRKRTALHWAAVKMNVDIAKELVNTGDATILHDSDARDHTALQLAAQSGEAELTEFLLEAGAKVGANAFRSDRDGRCALILAASSRRMKVVEILLGKGSDPMRDDDSGKSALGWAAMRGFDDVVKVILTRSGTTLKDEVIAKALKLAAEEGHLQVSIMLHEKLKEPRLQDSLVSVVLFSPAAAATTSTSATEELMKLVRDPNQQDEDGQTALMFAVENGKRHLFEKLLELKADPDQSDNQKRTPLMLAARSDDLRSVYDLLGANANADLQDTRGYTALHYAAEQGHFSIMSSLTEHRPPINANIQDLRGRTALHIFLEQLRTRPVDEWLYYVSRREYRQKRLLMEMLQSLLDSGARPDLQDEEKQTPLHWAVRRNRLDIARLLLQPIYNATRLDIPDGEGRTPLILAAERGYSDIVEMLLTDHSFDPDRQDHKDRTPLLLAAERGDDKSVGALLEKKANPNLADSKSRTALIKAAQNGHYSIVLALINVKEEGTKPYGRKPENASLDARDDMGRTALMLAAESGHSHIVRALQKQGANPSLFDYEGKKAWQRAMDKGHADIVDSLLSTPDAPNQDLMAVNEALLVASRRGWSELVEVLLNRKADVTFQHEEGTALHMAVMGGHVQVVQKLLENGIGIVAQDKKGRTALMLATEHGFGSIVKLLLDKKEVKDDINDWMGPEALRCAAEKDDRGIVRQLLGAKINPNGHDSAGRTALTLAAANGNQEVVDLLLKGQAVPNFKDKQHRTALHYAAWGGHAAVVKSLLGCEAEINALDNGEQVALHLAAERASKSVIQLLLEKGANPNARSKDGQTPLHRAAWGGSYDIVKLLRQRGADPFLQDSCGNKPWQVAAEKGFESIVEALLEEEGNIRDELISKRKALIFASQRGYAAMAEALLNKGAESMVADKDGLTPLHWAAKRGDYVMVKLLIRRGGPNMTLDTIDNHQQTPLCLAVQKGRATVARILLSNGADPNIVGQEGRTVLHVAAKENNSEIAEILVNHKVDPHVRDNQKQKAWLLAAKAGHHHIVRLLLAKEVDFNPRSQNIEDLFLNLAAQGFVPMVGLLLERRVNKDATDQRGRSAIAIAAKEQKGDVVKLLLSVGANPGIADSNLQTPLLWAAKTGNSRIVKMLLDYITGNNAESDGKSKSLAPSTMINHTDSKGRTALLIALKNKHDEVAKLLLDERLQGMIDPNLGDTTKKTALHFAAETGNDELLRLLLNQFADRTLRDALGRTPLFLAAERGQETAVELLLAPQQNIEDYAIEIIDEHSRTVLHVAAELGNSKMTRMLLDRNADKDYQDDLKRTALSLAVENGHKEVVDLLLEKEAKQNLPDSEKRTPLSLAVANGDKSIVEALLDHPEANVEAVDENGRTLLQLAVQSGNKEVTWLIAEQMTRLQGPRKDVVLPAISQDKGESSEGGGGSQ